MCVSSTSKKLRCGNKISFRHCVISKACSVMSFAFPNLILKIGNLDHKRSASSFKILDLSFCNWKTKLAGVVFSYASIDSIHRTTASRLEKQKQLGERFIHYGPYICWIHKAAVAASHPSFILSRSTSTASADRDFCGSHQKRTLSSVSVKRLMNT